MRLKITPDTCVTRAWKVRKAAIKLMHENSPKPNPAGVLSRTASQLLQKNEFEVAVKMAERLFIETVQRCHGPDIEIEIKQGEFHLYQFRSYLAEPTCP